MINTQERAIVALKLNAYPVRGALSLAAGTKQTLPAAGTCLIEVYANTVSGRRVTLVNRELQDAAAIYFPAATPEVDAQHYTYDSRDPTHFDVVPPNSGTGSIDALYGAVPTPIAAVGNAINLADYYETPIIHGVLEQAYAENTERKDMVKSAFYGDSWKKLIGAGTASTIANAPQQGKQGGS